MANSMTKENITLTVNNKNWELTVEPRKLLSDVLREDCRLTGTHVGCEHGVCGACTVLVDGQPSRSCLIYAIQMEGHDLKTIEAVAENGVLSQFQTALHEEHGLQCGFCTPGIVMTIEALIGQKKDPSDEDILDALSGNLCRCTGYQNILKAIRKVLPRNPAKEDPK